MLPNVLCIGVQKSGTTYLASLLRQHPNIFLPKQKELNFFCYEKLYAKGIDYYKKHFTKVENEKIIMESTPRYIIDEKHIKRIHSDLGNNTKIIIMIREPISRLISHYKMNYLKNSEHLTLNKVITKNFNEQINNYDNYIKRGLYADQIEMVLKYFNKENVYLMIFDDFIKHTQQELEKLAVFLGIDSKYEFDFSVDKNKSKNNKVNFLGKLYFLFPYRIRSKIIELLPYKKLKNRNRLLFKINSEVQIEEIESNLLKKLEALYEEQTNRLEKLYKIDLSKWKYYILKKDASEY